MRKDAREREPRTYGDGARQVGASARRGADLPSPTSTFMNTGLMAGARRRAREMERAIGDKAGVGGLEAVELARIDYRIGDSRAFSRHRAGIPVPHPPSGGEAACAALLQLQARELQRLVGLDACGRRLRRPTRRWRAFVRGCATGRRDRAPDRASLDRRSGRPPALPTSSRWSLENQTLPTALQSRRVGDLAGRLAVHLEASKRPT